MRKEEGKEVLRELVKVSDIVAQNFRPGAIESMDVCLADTGYSMTEIPITAYHGTKIPPKRGYTTAPRSGIYPCKEG